MKQLSALGEPLGWEMRFYSTLGGSTLVVLLRLGAMGPHSPPGLHRPPQRSPYNAPPYGGPPIFAGPARGLSGAPQYPPPLGDGP